MKFILGVKRKLTAIAPRSYWIGIVAAILLLTPAIASAAEGDEALRFSGSDVNYLIISFALGLVALFVAILLTREVLKHSPGSEAMQEVGRAIKEGALAYLKKQVTTMAIFVVILAVGLLFLYHSRYHSWALGSWMSVCFIGGVAASYVAGYTGMLMAVEGNVRTAHAALTSYSTTLKVAFRSGAVAGMVTVGMGLIGASVIFYFAQADAVKLLIGFGFGGSLAALFMRVGGGIFTKAADVGADLVGKVEAGIPEDDPRNPATIADNVGDNVGDCAGMAADIFESYEVTLVAAIILGAATSVIFDQSTWMKLILFALMARGAGIVASIIGIYSVKGSDDLDSDPLTSIRKGFWLSAGIAGVLTIGLAWFLMGGKDHPILTSQLGKSVEADRREMFAKIRDIRDELQKKNPTIAQNPQPLLDDPRIKAMGLTGQPGQQAVMGAVQENPEQLPVLKEPGAYHVVDFNGTSPTLKYGVITLPLSQKQQSVSFLDEFATKQGNTYVAKPIFMAKLHLVQTPPSPAKGQPPTPPQVNDIYYGPATRDDLKYILTQKSPNVAVSEINNSELPAAFYEDDAGHLAIGFDKPTDYNAIQFNRPSVGIFKEDAAAIQASLQHKTTVPMNPTAVTTDMFSESHQQVPWYMFALAIIFGIVMAFAIELLTDYYVSTHKRPVQEIAGVSSAGPAPMIIQGFALGAESSVFSVFAIVIALIMPLIFFPPSHYGGSYILSFYGIALVGLGLLTTTGFILAMDTFGPISDNAQGVFEMSGAGHTSPNGSKAVQRLDAAGNTTKALTKGFAIATAVVAAVALFHSYLDSAHLVTNGIRLEIPEIFLGLLIGGAAPYLFAAFAINAVGRASFQLINEVRRQFREDPGIMAGTSKPNYGRCVAIVTEAAQKELLGPGILAIALPVAVAFGFSIGKEPTMINGVAYNLVGAQALGGFLAGAILSGQLMAVLLANSGGMWDNAKKLIEDGLYGGKGSEAHKAGIVCDTVGDPFKDTAGPAMNPLIKVMNLVALLLAPVVILPYSNGVLASITIAAVALLAFSVWWSKRASFSSALASATESATHTPLSYEHPEEATHDTLSAPSGKRRITVDDAEEAPAEDPLE
jgi:K(+)-stimulated pyrophosphate-energized sodium pump